MVGFLKVMEISMLGGCLLTSIRWECMMYSKREPSIEGWHGFEMFCCSDSFILDPFDYEVSVYLLLDRKWYPLSGMKQCLNN